LLTTIDALPSGKPALGADPQSAPPCDVANERRQFLFTVVDFPTRRAAELFFDLSFARPEILTISDAERWDDPAAGILTILTGC
jgi:hypothetical protein